MGILTAGSATGQLIFLPILAAVTVNGSWRLASLIIAAAALAVVPLVLTFLHNHPADRGVTAYGAPMMPAGMEAAVGSPAVEIGAPSNAAPPANSAKRALQVFAMAAHHRTFWALMAGFAICGATTNGLIGTHFIPAAHDHGLGETTAAGLLAVVGVFDIVGTIASGYLTDRVNPRVLLALYYGFRGVGLLMLPGLLSDAIHPSIVAFVIVYGLDWVATVPPTVALCRQAFGDQGTIVFGWVFASHQVGAALASVAAGVIRDQTGAYTIAWFGAAGMCLVAALVSFQIRPLPTATAPAVTSAA
jgi:predicted MFS family arabinose efflux permease